MDYVSNRWGFGSRNDGAASTWLTSIELGNERFGDCWK